MELTLPPLALQNSRSTIFVGDMAKSHLHFDIVTYNGVLTRIFFTGVHRTHREAKRGS